MNPEDWYEGSYTKDWFNNKTEAEVIHRVTLYPYHLKYVQYQTERICLEAVRKNGAVLKYANVRTPNVIMEALSNHGISLRHIKEQTTEMVLTAIKNSIGSIIYINLENTTELKRILIDEGMFKALEELELEEAMRLIEKHKCSSLL